MYTLFSEWAERHIRYLISNSTGSVAMTNSDYELCYYRYLSPDPGEIHDFICPFGYSGQYFIIENMADTGEDFMIAEIELYEGK